MARKKERNHYDVKEIESYCRTKTFPKRLAGNREKANFRQTAKRFFNKKGNCITKREDLSLQVIIFKLTSFMISTNGSAILVTQKQCQLILGEPQHTNNLLHVSFRMEFTTTLRTIDQSKNSMLSQCFDGNVYYYRKVRFLYQKVKFLTSPNSSRYIACC